MTNAFIRKLEPFCELSESDRRFLRDLCRPITEVPANTTLLREGDKPESSYLFLDGFACRLKTTIKGARQIMAYFVPGDIFDSSVMTLRRMDHTIATLSPCRVVQLSRSNIAKLVENPRLAAALLHFALVDAAIMREWMLNMGGRSAEERVAHLLCELLFRLRAVGYAPRDNYHLPLTQLELGDTTGLSTVHIHRVMRRLRARKLVSWRKGEVIIQDIQGLIKSSGFDPNYLYLDVGSSGRVDQTPLAFIAEHRTTTMPKRYR